MAEKRRPSTKRGGNCGTCHAPCFCGVLTGQVMQKEMPTNAKALNISSGFQHHRPLVYSSTILCTWTPFRSGI